MYYCRTLGSEPGGSLAEFADIGPEPQIDRVGNPQLRVDANDPELKTTGLMTTLKNVMGMTKPKYGRFGPAAPSQGAIKMTTRSNGAQVMNEVLDT